MDQASAAAGPGVWQGPVGGSLLTALTSPFCSSSTTPPHYRRRSDAPVVDRLGAAYRVLRWRNGDEMITRRDAFDYVAALRVRACGGEQHSGQAGGLMLGWRMPACARAQRVCGALPAGRARPPRRPSTGVFLAPPLRRQVIFGTAHDPREWTAHMPEAMDGQFINEQVGGWVGMAVALVGMGGLWRCCGWCWRWRCCGWVDDDGAGGAGVPGVHAPGEGVVCWL